LPTFGRTNEVGSAASGATEGFAKITRPRLTSTISAKNILKKHNADAPHLYVVHNGYGFRCPLCSKLNQCRGGNL
jgi:hypothetical protein